MQQYLFRSAPALLAALLTASVLAPTTAQAAPKGIRGLAPRVRTTLKAMRALRRPIGLRTARGIWRAHLVGDGQLGRDNKTAARQGNYSDKQLKHKVKLLKGVGLSRADRRALMRLGVVGRKKKPSGRAPADEVHESDNPSFWKRLFRQEERDGHYSAKGGHRERSRHHQPQHDKHWKKEKKKK